MPTKILKNAVRRIIGGRVTEADIVGFYRNRKKLPRKPAPTLSIGTHTLTNTPTGLGDCVVLTQHMRHGGLSWSSSSHWKTLAANSPGHIDKQHPLWVSMSAATEAWDLGPGHHIQRMERLFGVPVSTLPSGSLHAPGIIKSPNRVIVHLEAGIHVEHQRKVHHPRAREVYPENVEIIRQFVRRHPEMEFWEIGSKRSIGDPAMDFTGKPLDQTIRLMASAQWHLGIISGPYHVAVALGLQPITIINFPAPWELMLPSLVSAGTVEESWLYPQSYILHQDHDSRHWPKFSAFSLEQAFNHEVYPYGDPVRFAQLIES